jgi:hypothetical protein
MLRLYPRRIARRYGHYFRARRAAASVHATLQGSLARRAMRREHAANSHRPRLGWDELGDTFGPTTDHPMNLGYTDGSVKFVDIKGGWVDYSTLH